MICIRFKHTTIEIHFLFVGMITLFLLIDRTGAAVLGLLAALIHELGHMIAFVATGYSPQRIAFEMCGIRLQKKTYEMSFPKEVFVLLAGSGMNFLVFCALCYSIGSVNTTSLFAVIHLVLGILNLMPVNGLDGGKLLRLFLGRHFAERTVDITCNIVQIALILPIVACSVYSVVIGAANFSLLMLCVYLISVCFLPQKEADC